MKKILSALSALLITSTSASSVVSCSTNNSSNWTPGAFEPNNGWPPKGNKDFLPIWQKFYDQTQNDISKNVGNIINYYSDTYQSLYLKYRDINKGKHDIDPDNYDPNGVPQKEIDKIMDTIAVSRDMYEYQKNSLRLYYIEINISILSNKDGKAEINQNELLNLWGMKYYRSYPFYQWAKIILYGTSPIVIYEVGINFNFYEFSGYLQQDGKGNIEWNLGPNDKSKNAKPTLKLRPEYYKAADQIYDELFGKGNNND